MQEYLVMKIKQIQRSGQEAKDSLLEDVACSWTLVRGLQARTTRSLKPHACQDAWYRYCESTRTGNHDPARHTPEPGSQCADTVHGTACW